MIIAVLAFWAQAALYPLGGTVVHGVTGEPLKGARVRLIESGSLKDIRSAVTGADGRFRFEGLASGKYMLYGQKNGFPGQMFGQKTLNSPVVTGVVLGEGQDASELLFKLIPPAAITGTVTNEKGEPLAGMSVYGYQRRGVGDAQRLQLLSRAITNDLGQYRLYGLAHGDFLVAVSGAPHQRLPLFDATGKAGGYGLVFHPSVSEAAKAAWVRVRPGEEGRADVQMHILKTVRIMGTWQGTAPPNGAYAALAVPLGAGEYASVGDPAYISQGRFQFESIPPGRYEIFAQSSGYRVIAHQVVEVADDPTELVLDSARMATVQVKLNWSDASPQGEIVTRLVPIGQAAAMPTSVSPKGEASLGPVSAGLYTLQVLNVTSRTQLSVDSVAAEGARVRGQIVEIPDSGQVVLTAGVNLRTVAVNGRVYKQDRPIAGMTVLLIPERKDATAVAYRVDQSDSDGSFKWSDVPPGEYLMFAFEDGASWDYMDEGVMQGFRSLGQPLTVRSGGNAEVRLELTRTPK